MAVSRPPGWSCDVVKLQWTAGSEQRYAETVIIIRPIIIIIFIIIIIIIIMNDTTSMPKVSRTVPVPNYKCEDINNYALAKQARL